jgi:hypothetical protein
VSPLQEKLLAELTPELKDRVQYAEVSCVEEKNGKYRFLANFFWNILDLKKLLSRKSNLKVITANQSPISTPSAFRSHVLFGKVKIYKM